MPIDHEGRAHAAWDVLTRVAKSSRPQITYAELGRRIGIHHRAVKFALELIQNHCMSHGLPALTILVVNAAEGRPGQGFIAREMQEISRGIEEVRAYHWEGKPNPFRSPRTTSNSGPRVWRLVAHHERPATACEIMIAESRIAIGWGQIGDLTLLNPSTEREIGAAIRVALPDLANSGLGGPSLWRFYDEAKIGDLVILSGKTSRVAVLEITGDYYFSDGAGSVLGYPHQRGASLTQIDANELWASLGSEFAKGESGRWTFARCGDASPSPDHFEEGRRYDIVASAYERNPQARAACLAHHGHSCVICGFNFQSAYGEIGRDFIHVHHLTELSRRGGAHKVDPINDLVPLCPNCHAMVHTERPARTLEDLKSRLRK